MTDTDFFCSILNKNYIEISNKNSSVLLKPPLILELLFNQYNNSSPERQNDPENVVNSRYFNIDQIQSLELCQKEKSLSLFHINACSLNKNFDELVYLLKCTNKNFDIIAVSETRISKKNSLTSNINLKQLQQNQQQVEQCFMYPIACLINHELTLICIKKIS